MLRFSFAVPLGVGIGLGNGLFGPPKESVVVQIGTHLAVLANSHLSHWSFWQILGPFGKRSSLASV